MKVLVFTSLYPNNVWPNHGVFIKERMTHFAKLDGCEIKVVAPVPYFPAIKLNWRWNYSQVVPFEVRDGIEVYHPRYYMLPKIGMSLYGLFLFLSVLGTVRKIQRTFDFDLVDAHFVYPDGFAAVLLSWFLGKPVVISARGSDVNRYSSFPLIRQLLRYTLNKADRVVAVSSALKRAMIQLGVKEENIHVVPNGVNLNRFHCTPKLEARQLLGLPLRSKIVLCVGHLTANKGFDLVVRSVKVLREQYQKKQVFLVIVGDGVLSAKLKKLVSSSSLSDHVLFTGAINNEVLSTWYSAADVFCLASEREGWPNVILESLACGTPVVATAVGGIPEIIASEELGLLTEREEAAIANAIHIVLNKTWTADDLARYAEKHTWKHTALSIRQMFDDVLAGRDVLTQARPNGQPKVAA